MIDPQRFGVSFSLKQCRNFGLDPEKALHALISDMGLRRFRLMSYWDEHEQAPGEYDFTALDKQLDMIAKADGVVTMCLGVRQPRYPESHWPDWAYALPKTERDAALLTFITKIVKRYQNRACIVSWQLENEALLKTFGLRGDFDRTRFKNEYRTVKLLDPGRHLIMTTSTSWGIPIRQPIPDTVGFSYYRVTFSNGKYGHSLYYPWIFKLRHQLIRLIHRKPSFIHEMQAEPWGPKNIWDMTLDEQNESMSLENLEQNITLAKSTKLFPIDLWGGEWWYWRKTVMHDDTIWNMVELLLQDTYLA